MTLRLLQCSSDNYNRITPKIKNIVMDCIWELSLKPWFPGYKARIGRKQLSVKVVNLLMPAVIISPGTQGVVKLYYFPDLLVVGLIIMGISLLLFIFCTFYKQEANVSQS